MIPPARASVRRRIELVAGALGEELARVVLVGGAAVALYDRPPDPRMTTSTYLAVPEFEEAVGFTFPSSAEAQFRATAFLQRLRRLSR